MAVVACSAPPAPQRQLEVHREEHVLVYGPPEQSPGEMPPVRLDQPPETKLRLGHYANAARGIGLVIDLTRTPARIQFDGSAAVVTLDRQAGPSGRVDFIRRIGDPVLRIEHGPRVQVFVDGEAIEVRRDGDAEPL